MGSSDAPSSRSNSAIAVFVVALVLIVGSAGCGSYAGYWFVKANAARNELKSRLSARMQPSGQEAEWLLMMFGVLSGVGPVGIDLAAVAEIANFEKEAWKYLSFALMLGFAGFQLLRHARGIRSSARPIKLPGLTD